MEHNVRICKRTQCEIIENERVLTSVYGPLSSVDLGVVFLRLWESFSLILLTNRLHLLIIDLRVSNLRVSKWKGKEICFIAEKMNCMI